VKASLIRDDIKHLGKVAKKAPRASLQNIFIKDGRVYAGNGYILVCRDMAVEEADNLVAIPVEMLKGITGGCKVTAKKKAIVLDDSLKKVVGHEDLRARRDVDVDSLLPKGEVQHEISFRIDILKGLLDGIPGGLSSVKFLLRQSDQPVEFRTSGAYYGLIMPYGRPEHIILTENKIEEE